MTFCYSVTLEKVRGGRDNDRVIIRNMINSGGSCLPKWVGQSVTVRSIIGTNEDLPSEWKHNLELL